MNNLEQTIEYLSDEQKKFILELINTFSNGGYVTKGDICKLVFDEKTNGKIDTAIPMDYVNRLKELNKNFATQHHVFSYIDSYGELINVSEKLVEKLTEIFNR